MKRKALVGTVLLVLSSLLLGACAVPQEEIDKYIAELGELAGNLDAIDASAAQGNWEEAQSSLEQAKIHHSNIEEGINELEQKGVEPAQIARGRAASTYLHKAVEIIDRMLVVHRKTSELRPKMEVLSQGTQEDVARALDALNELTLVIPDTKSSIKGFLDYANNYHSSNPEDARKLRVDTAIPKMEQLHTQLDVRETEFKGYIGTLSKS
ncbi:hypothetical protein ACFLYE_00650 [Chloroflexota bacterium]